MENRHWPNVPGYEIIGDLGRGGFASVYRARQISVDRLVAVKVIAVTAVDSEMERRFRSECRTVGALSWHPHVVALHDAGITPDGAPYLAMELFPDGSLGDLVKSGHVMTPADVTRAGIQVADALDAAHSAGILHRDVKPDNLLIGRRGEVRLGDFGIATLTDGTVTVGQGFTGTLMYTAPEVLQGQRASVSADIYALGTTLYTLLVGRPAFAPGTEEIPAAIMWRVVTEPAPPLPATVPRALAAAVEQAMSKDPAQRHPSATAFQQHLEYVQATLAPSATPTAGVNETIRIPGPPPVPLSPAGPPTTPGSTVLKGRRRTVLLALVAVLAVAALVGAGIVIANGGDDKEPPTEDAGSDGDNPVTAVAHTLSGMRGTSPGAEVSAEFANRLRSVDADVDTGRRWSVETYDAVIVTALAVVQADTDGLEFANEINEVTRSGERCTDFAGCVALIEDGVDIDYDGQSGFLDFSGNGEPTRAEYSVLEFGDDNRIDFDRTEVRTGEVPQSFDVPQQDAEGRRDGDGILRIGALAPLTGSAEILGPPMTAAIEVAKQEINESGGVLGESVVVQLGDSGDVDSDLAGNTVGSMIDEGVDAIVGPITTAVTLTIIDQVVDAGVVLFSPGNTWEMLSDYDDSGLYFRTASSDILQAQVLAETIVDDGNDSVGLIHSDWDNSSAFADNLERFLIDLGAGDVEVQQYARDADNFAQRVTAVAVAEPDAVVVIGYAESSSVLCELARQELDASTTDLYGVETNTGDALGEGFAACE